MKRRIEDMNLYAHQSAIIDADPEKCGLFLGTGSGKTRIALLLARGRTLVICPLTQKMDQNWERELEALGNPNKITLHVVSKEIFRRDWETVYVPAGVDTIIVDEAHTCLGVTPNTRWRNKTEIPKASQLFEALDAFLARTAPSRLYFCTATIMKSPMTVWAAEKLLGHTKGDMRSFLDFRQAFYQKLPMPGREVYAPKSTQECKDKLADSVKKMGYIGRLEDYFDVPGQTFKTVHVDLTASQKARIRTLTTEYPDPIVRIGKQHQVENGSIAANEYEDGNWFDNEKCQKIFEYALEFARMVIFCKYRAQILELKNELEKRKYKVFTLTGDTKDRGSIIAEANASDNGIFIAQAQISAGWELPSYPVMIFASRTYSFVDYDQAIGRIHRANALKKNLYINLVVKGGIDEAVDRALKNKSDFNERLYAHV